MPGVQSERDVLQTLERWIDDSLRQPFAIDGHEHWMTVKTGIAMHPSDGDDADTLLRHAEAALARAKATGESALFYTQKMTAHMTERLTLENRLRRAFENDEFELYYQPKVDLATRSLAGVEALARWRGPGDVLVPPSDFIPLMEETGLILELGAWALGRAARDQSTWREQGLPTPRVAVNVSATQLCRADFVETVERARRQCDGVAELDIEITETLLMEDVGGNIDKIAALRRLGVGVAIDDFGTGYSSLAYLARFPVDTLKIDRHFTSLMLQDEASLALIQTMIALSHSLKLQVVAEGVETEKQAALLSQLGCDVIQGFLIARPMSMEDLAAYLRATQTVPTVS
ncbi:MAG TPA: GGDEF domain-containing phosphodiesterase, partial [Burkholderiaceae bacterium]|nr:GGDEF domain-containing phosphodiesterase [Burkholderiaceae bacterium]